MLLAYWENWRIPHFAHTSARAKKCALRGCKNLEFTTKLSHRHLEMKMQRREDIMDGTHYLMVPLSDSLMRVPWATGLFVGCWKMRDWGVWGARTLTFLNSRFVHLSINAPNRQKIVLEFHVLRLLPETHFKIKRSQKLVSRIKKLVSRIKKLVSRIKKLVSRIEKLVSRI